MDEGAGLSVIVRVVTRWLLGPILVYGVALAAFGHLTPGGGFAGGVVVASGFVLATLAFGARTGPGAWMRRWASALDAGGALAFLAVAVLGWAAGGFFHAWLARGEAFTLASAPCIVLINLAILLKVGAGCFAGFMGLVLFDRALPGGHGGGA